MKTVKRFEDFINESVNVKYWADYHEKSTKITSTSKVARAVEDEVEEWNLNNEDGKDNEVTNKDEKKVMNLAHDFFKAAGWISADVIQAMIAQEAIGESIVNEGEKVIKGSFGVKKVQTLIDKYGRDNGLFFKRKSDGKLYGVGSLFLDTDNKDFAVIDADGDDEYIDYKDIDCVVIKESIVNEADEKPSLDSATGLIYYFDIPFTSEDMEELLSASKAILNAKFTPNKQFEIQPMIFIKDKVNGGEHTFNVAQIGILGAFFDKNKKSVASRKDF